MDDVEVVDARHADGGFFQGLGDGGSGGFGQRGDIEMGGGADDQQSDSVFPGLAMAVWE